MKAVRGVIGENAAKFQSGILIVVVYGRRKPEAVVRFHDS